MEGLFRGRLNHLIGIKIGDKMQIFDYATDEKIKKIQRDCHINSNEEFSYKRGLDIQRTRDCDLDAIYLGQISSETYRNLNDFEQIKERLENQL